MSLCIYFPWNFLCFLLRFFVNGCGGFNHPREGRDALGEGVSWAQQFSWEIFPCVEMVLVCSWSMGSMEAICLLYFGRYKGVCVKRRNYWKPWRGMLRICKLYICFEDMTFSSLESPPSPHVLDSHGESMCKTLEGIVMCLCDLVYIVRWMYVSIYTLFPPAWWVASMRPRLGGESMVLVILL